MTSPAHPSGEPGGLSRRWVLVLLLVSAWLIASTALSEAVSWYGHPIPGFLVDPNGVVSSAGLAEWHGRQQGLTFPDRVVAVNGAPLPGARKGTALYAEAKRLYEGGDRELRVTVVRAGETRDVTVRVEPLDALAWWVLFGSLFFAGSLYIGAGAVALTVRPEGALARTFAAAGVAYGTYMLLFFDFHTTARLTILAAFVWGMIPALSVMLPLRLPDDAPLLRQRAWVEPAVRCVGAALGLGFAGSYALESDAFFPFQRLMGPLLAAGLLCAVVLFGVRYVYATGNRRATMRALLVTMLPPHAAVALSILLGPSEALWSRLDVISYPALTLAPLATGYAFVRYDLWGSRAILSRLFTNIVIAALTCAGAAAAGTAFAVELGASLTHALVAATFAAVFATALVVVALRTSDRVLFSARERYKPTIEQLSEDLTTLASPAEVARAIERTVLRWLPCERVEIVLVDPARGRDSGRRAVLTIPPDGTQRLELPVRFAGEQLGTLVLGHKRDHALFTSDDVDLLRTIVNQGAVALAYAHAYEALEQQRRQQVEAWRDEREALVETVAAEIAHEVRYPINFFRSIFEASAAGEPLDEEDLDIGREETDRLERLVSGLRRLSIHRLERKAVLIEELCNRARVLLRDQIGDRTLEVEVPQLALRCDGERVTQILVNLLSNAIEAAGPAGQIGVSFAVGTAGGTLTVWDDGPGFSADPAQLFAPWFSTKDRGTGLGLAITHRLVRAHGWSVAATRAGDRTKFLISVPSRDLAGVDETANEEVA